MIATTDTLTVADSLLLAAKDLPAEFTAEQLAVAAWRADPGAFGLDGYADEYPDNNRCNCALMGQRGLIHKGLLRKLGPKRYTLSREGRARIAVLTGTAPEPGPDAVLLSADRERFLSGLLGSDAYRKVDEGRKGELTFADATDFWSLPRAAVGEAVDAHLRLVATALRELEDALAQGDGRMPAGRRVTAGDVRALANIDGYLRDRFERLLNLLRNRNTRPEGNPR